MKEAVIGIDIGGTNTDIALVDKKGTILSRTHLRTTDFPEFESFANQVAQDARSLISNTGANLNAMGIGAPNGNYYSGMIEFAPNLAWKGKIDVAGELHNRLGIPVFLTNDANAAAIGEMKFGVAGELKDFVMITLGTGVGSGVVANGQLIYGHDGFAGEIGHMTSTPGGRLCGCGRKGCLETYSSVTGLRKSVIFMHEEQKMAGKLENIPYENLTGKMIEIAALEGDVVAREAFRLAGKELGKALANVAAVTSPSHIVLFGGMAAAGPLIFEPLRKYLEENLLAIYKNKIEILPSGLDGNNAAILGAAALAWNELEKHKK